MSSVALAWAKQKRSEFRGKLAASVAGFAVACVVVASVFALWLHLDIHREAIAAVAISLASIWGQHWLAKKVEAANQ